MNDDFGKYTWSAYENDRETDNRADRQTDRQTADVVNQQSRDVADCSRAAFSRHSVALLLCRLRSLQR